MLISSKWFLVIMFVSAMSVIYTTNGLAFEGNLSLMICESLIAGLSLGVQASDSSSKVSLFVIPYETEPSTTIDMIIGIQGYFARKDP